MQFALPLECNDIEYRSDDFIISCCNIDAYNMVTSPQKWKWNRLLLIGEEGSGKTHLANIFKTMLHAETLTESLLDINSGIFKNQLPKAIVIENINNINSSNFIFHIINIATENNIPLLLTAAKYPYFALKDLQSRINSTLKALIKNPSDDFLRVILLKQFNDRQLIISKDILEFIMTRCRRSFSYIKTLVEHLDKATLEQKRKVSINLVKDIFDLIEEQYYEN